MIKYLVTYSFTNYYSRGSVVDVYEKEQAFVSDSMEDVRKAVDKLEKIPVVSNIQIYRCEPMEEYEA